MTIYSIQLNAQLNSIEALWIPNQSSDDFDYFFKISCIKCHEQHNKAVVISRQDQVDIPNSSQTANFVFKCGFCGNSSHINLLKAPVKYTSDDSGSQKSIFEIEARGVEIKEFLPEGFFEAKSSLSNQIFNEVELTDDWYDVDEKTMEEVSITDIKFEILRA